MTLQPGHLEASAGTSPLCSLILDLETVEVKYRDEAEDVLIMTYGTST